LQGFTFNAFPGLNGGDLMDAKRKATVKMIVAAAVIVVAGLAAYLYWSQTRGGSAPVKEQAQPAAVAPATVVPVAPQAAAKDACEESREKLQGLFAYLDGRDYIASRQLKGGTAEHFKGLLARLLKTPPFVQRQETESLENILRNRAHFYRVLGKQDALLLRDVVRKEGDILESSLAILYQALLLQEKCGAGGTGLQVRLEDVYPYALFFLNTLGGSSYLQRRDSRGRILVRYYSVLVVDQADRRKLNPLGLSIGPDVKLLLEDLKGATNLSRKDEYIATLTGIAAR